MADRASYGQFTLLELSRRIDPNGEAAKIAEVLARDNEILLDAVWQPANAPFANKSTRRSALPTGSWRSLNDGYTVENSQTIEIWDVIGMLGGYCETDIEAARAHPGGAKEFRNSEAEAWLEGLAQTFASTFIYGDVRTDPEKFMGLGPRMDNLAAAANVIGAGGTGSDVSSVFVVQWGPRKVHMIYPSGSKTGISHRDLGEQTKEVTATWGTTPPKLMQVYRDLFEIKAGLVVKNPRCIGRIANCETSGSANIFDEDLLIKILNRMPERGKGAVIYANATIISYMEILLKDKTNVNFTPSKGEGLAGEPVMRFRGCPVRKVDAIVDTETALT
jgi:hypothetical protein